MNQTTATFEVQREGQQSRLFRFSEPTISIGFAPRCDLSLEPGNDSGVELLCQIYRKPCTLTLKGKPGVFQLNDRVCEAETPVKTGDVITTGSHRIIIRSLPAPPTGPPEHPEETSITKAFHGQESQKGEMPTKAASKSIMQLAGQPEEQATQGPSPSLAKTPKPDQAPLKKTAPKAGLSYLYLFFASVQHYLADDDVSEILINGPGQIYIERKGKLTAVPETFATEQALQAALINVARSVGRFFDKDNPRLDARLPDGSRVHAVMPPLSRAGTIVAIRKFRREKLTMEQLVQFGSISTEGAQLLDVIVKTGRNLIVSGATSSGKTSVLNVLSSLIPDHDRILVLEDASELQLQQAHKVCFETRKPDEYGKGEVTIRDLLHSALRLRPDRIVVGEIRGVEALDLLQAMNTGHDGSMSTIHANSPRDSLLRIETCALLSGIGIPLSALREQVASAIHIIIQTARLHDGTRKITAISEVLGLKDREYHLQDILIFQTDGMGADGKIEGRHAFTGYQPAFFESARRAGLPVDSIIQNFKQPQT
jgi:pilus assembly protein CpaF